VTSPTRLVMAFASSGKQSLLATTLCDANMPSICTTSPIASPFITPLYYGGSPGLVAAPANPPPISPPGTPIGLPIGSPGPVTPSGGGTPTPNSNVPNVQTSPDEQVLPPDGSPVNDRGVGGAVGGSIGGVLGLALIIALIVFLVRRKRKAKANAVPLKPLTIPGSDSPPNVETKTKGYDNDNYLTPPPDNEATEIKKEYAAIIASAQQPVEDELNEDLQAKYSQILREDGDEIVTEGIARGFKKRWMIPIQEIQFGQKIGSGAFGLVYKGTEKSRSD